MALATTTATTIAAVSAVAAAGIGAVGAVQQGRAQRKQAEFTAAVQRQQAERERLEAASREEDFRRDQSRLMAERRARMGASGVEMGAGSPLMASEDFAAEAELQALRLRSGGELRATRLEQSATLQTMAGRNAQTAGFFRAGSLLVSGAGKAAGFAGGSTGGRTAWGSGWETD